jgi:hypothetical protein
LLSELVLHNRFYEPSLQRWLNRDPIGELGGINLYGFVGNNPMSFVDPYGLSVEPGGLPLLGPLLDQLVQGVKDLYNLIKNPPPEEPPVWSYQESGEVGPGWYPRPAITGDMAEPSTSQLMLLGLGFLAPELFGARAKPACHLGGKGRDCIACTAEHLAGSLGSDAMDLPALRQFLNTPGNDVWPWKNAVSLIEQHTGLLPGKPVFWENAGPGHYALFSGEHVVYGYVPPASPNLFRYVFDPQNGQFFSAMQQFNRATAVPFTR